MKFCRAVLLVSLGLGLLVAPLAAGGEQPGKVFRIGILANIPLADPEGAHLWRAFIQGLRELGYVEGQNITIEWRVSEGKYERLPDLAAELVRLKVDVTSSTQVLYHQEISTSTSWRHSGHWFATTESSFAAQVRRAV